MQPQLHPIWEIAVSQHSRAPNQPHTWWHYIHVDDIFMIWTHSVNDIYTFTPHPNSIHPIIKFASTYSFTSIPFLDAMLTFFSITAISQLIFALKPPTNINTCYILHITLNISRAIPFSLALGLRGICSPWRDFQTTFYWMNSNLTLTNVDIIYLSLVHK